MSTNKEEVLRNARDGLMKHLNYEIGNYFKKRKDHLKLTQQEEVQILFSASLHLYCQHVAASHLDEKEFLSGKGERFQKQQDSLIRLTQAYVDEFIKAQNHEEIQHGKKETPVGEGNTGGS